MSLCLKWIPKKEDEVTVFHSTAATTIVSIITVTSTTSTNTSMVAGRVSMPMWDALYKVKELDST